VLIGLLWLGGVLVNALRGRLRAQNARAVEFVGLYWHFVDMVWMIIFPVVYLMEFAR
jgi:heme/copper-type cytochrome/quinol oxidase subunit 3